MAKKPNLHQPHSPIFIPDPSQPDPSQYESGGWAVSVAPELAKMRPKWLLDVVAGGSCWEYDSGIGGRQG